MKKSELKAIIRECINEASRPSTNVRNARERIGRTPKTQKWTSNIKTADKGYLKIGVPFGDQKLAWDDLYDDFDSLTAAISKAYHGAKQFQRGYEAKGKYWFSYELGDEDMAEDLKSDLAHMAKKISSELERAIKHSEVEVS